MQVTTQPFRYAPRIVIPAQAGIHFQILARHATWHIVGAFGFITLWAFNHMRFVMRPL